MDRYLRRTRLSVTIMGIALVLLGAVILFNPTAAVLFVTLAVGWTLAAVGGVTVAGCCMSPQPTTQQLEFAIGIVELVVGLCVIAWPGFFVSIIYLVIGIVILLTGFSDVTGALTERAAGSPTWWVSLIIAIVTVVVGAVVCISPFVLADIVTMLCGIALIIDGLSEVYVGLRIES